MAEWDRHMVFSSSDHDVVEQETARVLSPHRLFIMTPHHRLDARLDRLPLGQVELVRLQYQADVKVKPGVLGSLYLVTLPLSGRAVQQIGSETVEVNPERGSVASATREFKFKADVEYTQMIFRIDREALERRCAEVLGHPLNQPIDFEPGVDLRSAAGEQWLHMAGFVIGSEAFVENLQIHSRMAQHLEGLVIDLLLTTQPHTYSDELERGPSCSSPYYVRRAEEYMRTYPGENISLRSLARVVGVSERSLLAGFRKHRGVSPMAMLRDIRLTGVHEALAQAESREDTVTDIAFSWGFTHLGCFSAAYRRKYGRRPSETLAEAKRMRGH
ncbi:MAG: AraC family transcriptional regulator [Gaiellales bacterium]|nr:AraC family transcriptional regulator [Gaiellales bacterium]